MKKTAIIFALTLCAMTLSGCSILFEEPSTLILPPASDQEEYVERTLINSFLSNGEHLVVPEDMEDPAAFIDLDLDGDDSNEKLAFWSNNNGHEVGVLLMKQGADGSWELLDQIRQYGNDVNYFKMVDLDNDGNDEACIGIDVGGNNVLYVYKLSGEGFSEIKQFNYSYLEIADMNGDGANTILCALNDYDDTTPTATLTMYAGSGTMESLYQKTFDGNCIEMAFGPVSTTKTGLYFIHTNNYSNLNVELLLPTEENGFDEQLTASVRYANATGSGNPIISDVTGDGVLDVRTLVEPTEPSQKGDGDALYIWKSWDGADYLSNVYGVFENTTDGYSFVLPSYCLDTVRYQWISEKGNSQVRFYDGAASEPSIILYALTGADERGIANYPGIIALGTSPSSQRSYYALCNTQTFAGQFIDMNNMKQFFQIKGGQ